MEALQKIFPANNFALLLLILGMPLIGAFVNGVFGKRLGKDAVRLMALSALGISFVGAVVSFLMLRAVQHESDLAARFVWHGWEWIGLSRAGEASFIHAGAGSNLIRLEIAFSIDALNGTMALIVTGIGFLIHLYSSSYMAEDPGYHRFFAYLNLFIFSMLVLILGDSLPILFVGWEGVGLCSYLLIGFWFDSEANARAGKKAFIVNRVGDFGLLVAMALLVRYTGALDWDGINAGSAGLLTEMRIWDGQLFSFLPDFITQPRSVSVATLVGLALFLGCAGKSAQVPLYTWLPDAMAGPTPVSALIHAATMVTAGIYLVCRLSGVFTLSPAAMLVVASAGAFTALFAASIALVQRDIKKVLAYSTVSQLGYMFLGVGVGAFTAGFFHVLTHAFFKACLFLGAGSVIHAMHARIHDTDASQDVNNMGGLKKYLKVTHATFLVSVLAIAGMPFTSGFFSKDEILYSAFTRSVVSERAGAFEWPSWAGSVLFAVGVTAAVMTAFYMFRVYFLTFHGTFKGWRIVPGWHEPHGHHDDHHHDHHHHSGPIDGPEPHESPWQMTLPLVILATLAAFGGFLNAAPLHIVPLEHWLEPLFSTLVEESRLHNADPDHALMMPLLVPGVLAFLIGTTVAWVIYIKQSGAPAKSLAERFPALYQLLVDKWRVDELYDELIVGSLEALAEASVWFDRWVVDGIIARLTALLVTVWGHLLRLLQTGHAQAYAAMMVLGMGVIGWFVAVPQPKVIVSGDAATGQYSLQAAPGLGYSYRWDSNGDGTFDSEDFGSTAQVTVRLDEGATQDVRLEVRNAFGRTRSGVYQLSRPRRDGSTAMLGHAHGVAGAGLDLSLDSDSTRGIR